MATPKKSVHWGINNSFSDTGASPSFSSTSSDCSSSTLEYVNAQLVAHGFAPPPGLSLEGVSNANSDRIAKCLLELLGQRTNDIARTEDLSTKLRVLQYDYERLQSIHRTTQSSAENAERETNLHKSRLAAASKALQATETAHKQTSAELQRTRSSLQSVRTAHQTELKRKEREVERMMERWSKVADVQSKLSTVPAGMTCANAEPVVNTELLGKSQNFLEAGLEQAEQARSQLSTENVRLKKLVLRTVNQLHALIFRVYNPGCDDEPPQVEMDTIFPLNPPDAAEQRVSMMINEFEYTLASDTPHITETNASHVEVQSNPRYEAEITRLQNTISSLRRDIHRLQEESSAQLQEAQTQFEDYVQKKEKLMVDVEHANTQEKETLSQATRDLEGERRALTEEAKRLQKDRAIFEAEKSSWEAQNMLVDNPVSQPVTALPVQAIGTVSRRISPQKQRPQRKSQGKSPTKSFKVGKSNRRRAVTTAQVREALAPPATKKVTPSYQTEVIPIPAITLTGTSSHATTSNQSPGKTLLTTYFVLPPPSPQASLPAHPMDLGQPIPPPRLLTPFSLPKLPELSSSESSDAPSSSHTPLESPPGTDENNENDLMAPFPRTYPVAKPLAQRMVHAYSPVKPSPLSRVVVSTSPSDSSSNGGFDSSFTNAGKESLESWAKRIEPTQETFMDKDEEMTLAQQLGLPDSPPDSSLKRKRADSSGPTEGTHQKRKPSSSRTHLTQTSTKTTGKGRVLVRGTQSGTTTTRKKGKVGPEGGAGTTSDKRVPPKHNESPREASSSSGTTTSSKAMESSSGASQVEKENEQEAYSKHRSTSTGPPKPSKGSRKAAITKPTPSDTRGNATKSSSSQPTNTNGMSARARLLAKLPPSSKGPGVSGPRRVLVESSESDVGNK